LLLIGVVLRLSQYIANRSLWLDEAMLALNIVNRSFVELLQPLDYAQGAPLGFLFLEKALTLLFGNADYVLRFVPLICGLVLIWLIYVLAERILLRAVAVVAAVALSVVSESLIYYASEIKQYSGDALMCLLLILATVRYLDGNLRHRVLAPLGAVAIWF